MNNMEILTPLARYLHIFGVILWRNSTKSCDIARISCCYPPTLAQKILVRLLFISFLLLLSLICFIIIITIIISFSISISIIIIIILFSSCNSSYWMRIVKEKKIGNADALGGQAFGAIHPYKFVFVCLLSFLLFIYDSLGNKELDILSLIMVQQQIGKKPD